MISSKENSVYEISNCGEFYNPVNEGKVIGKIFGWEYEITE